MKKWLCLAALVAVLAWWIHEPAADWPGLPAPRDPEQDTQQLPPPFKHGEHTITPLARYALQAVVLGRERYRNDINATLAPVDLALGWGPMSAAAAINGLTVTQSARWYEYRWGSEGAPLDPTEIAQHSANTHCIPATPEIREKLLAVRRHQLVALGGYLVEVSGPGGYRWRSSLSRGDTAGGACELVWIVTLDSGPIVAR